MKLSSFIRSAMLLLFAAGMLASPAQAGESLRVYEEEISKSDTASDDTVKSKGVISRIVAGPKAAVGITCGALIGVPIRIAKDTKKYTMVMRGSMSDGLEVEQKGDLVGKGFAAATAIPFGVGSGLIHGTIRGVETAVKVGAQKPLSKESMSIGKSE